MTLAPDSIQSAQPASPNMIDHDDKDQPSIQHQEKAEADLNLVYDDAEHEPALRATTWLALLTMCLFNFVVTSAVNTPPAALTYIGTALHQTEIQSWVTAALTVPQAVLCPLLATIADLFQIRKPILLTAMAIAFIGCGIAPGSNTINRLIAAQVLIGIGCSSLPLGYSIPSEILPRKWRQFGQAAINVGSALGAIVGPLSIGALTRDNQLTGWRKFWWIEMAMWGASALGVLVAYRPPPRHTRLDHLTFRQKLRYVDFIGAFLLLSGLILMLVGINLGGGEYGWKNVRVYVCLPLGFAITIAFGVYEWRFTKVGILNHDLFQGGKDAGRTFAVSVALIFMEGLMLFSFVLFYALITSSIYEPDPFKAVARQMPFWLTTLFFTGVWAWVSIRLRRIREPLIVAFAIFAAALAAMASIQPGSSTAFIVYAGVAGIGFSGLIVLILTATHLAVPHALITTATAITVASRSISASVAAAVYIAVFSSRLKHRLPEYVGQAAVAAGLPPSSIPAFVQAIAATNIAGLGNVPDVTPAIIAAGIAAFKRAFLDSARVVYIIAASLGGLSVALCLIMGNQRSRMDYVVDAPVERLEAKHSGHTSGSGA